MPRLKERELPSQEKLKEIFTYFAEDGVLIWNKRPEHHFPAKVYCDGWNTKFASKIAGAMHHSGYRQINLSGTLFFAHRIIWKYQTGNEPPKNIDHVNGNGADNRWLNLREATTSQNLMNQCLSTQNTSGLKDASYRSRDNKWLSQIKSNKKHYYLGIFDTAEEAHAAYCRAAVELHGEFANFG